MMNLDELKNILKKSWSKKTSYCPKEWNKENPALGQCAVTALVVNDYFGGDIVWSEAILSDLSKISHYLNRVNGKIIDFTVSQFPKGTEIRFGVKDIGNYLSLREYILGNSNTANRYMPLKKAIEKICANPN